MVPAPPRPPPPRLPPSPLRLQENLVEDLLNNFEYQVQNPYIIYSNAAEEITGIWFYDPEECEEVARLFSSEDDLVQLCSQYGDVEQSHIVVDKTTKLSTGRGYVLFSLPDSAVRALGELDNFGFHERLLHIKAARPLNNKAFDSSQFSVDEKMNLKQQKLEQKKASKIGGDTRAWNSFYMRQDTVVENIARKNGISKSELLHREADDLAVRIALGETHVIAETKKYLSRSRVNVAALKVLRLHVHWVNSCHRKQGRGERSSLIVRQNDVSCLQFVLTINCVCVMFTGNCVGYTVCWFCLLCWMCHV